MAFNLKTTCAKCAKEIEPFEMRAVEGGKKFMCKACYETKHQNPLSSSGVKLRTPEPQAQQKTINDSGKTFFEYKEWVCDACKYHFKRSPEFLVKKCPFCGKEDYVHQKIEQPANELLKDWSEM